MNNQKDEDNYGRLTNLHVFVPDGPTERQKTALHYIKLLERAIRNEFDITIPIPIPNNDNDSPNTPYAKLKNCASPPLNIHVTGMTEMTNDTFEEKVREIEPVALLKVLKDRINAEENFDISHVLGFKLSPIPSHEKPIPEQETLLQQIDFYYEELKKIHLKEKLDQDAKEVGPYPRETSSNAGTVTESLFALLKEKAEKTEEAAFLYRNMRQLQLTSVNNMIVYMKKKELISQRKTFKTWCIEALTIRCKHCQGIKKECKKKSSFEVLQSLANSYKSKMNDNKKEVLYKYLKMKCTKEEKPIDTHKQTNKCDQCRKMCNDIIQGQSLLECFLEYRDSLKSEISAFEVKWQSQETSYFPQKWEKETSEKPYEKPIPEQETLLQEIDFYYEELKKIHLKEKWTKEEKKTEVGKPIDTHKQSNKCDQCRKMCNGIIRGQSLLECLLEYRDSIKSEISAFDVKSQSQETSDFAQKWEKETYEKLLLVREKIEKHTSKKAPKNDEIQNEKKEGKKTVCAFWKKSDKNPRCFVPKDKKQPEIKAESIKTSMDVKALDEIKLTVLRSWEQYLADSCKYYEPPDDKKISNEEVPNENKFLKCMRRV